MYIYVGNLSTQTAGNDLRREFEAFGEVTKAAIVTGVDRKKPAGFGFVRMANEAAFDAALTGMAGKTIHGRLLEIRKTRRVVDESNSKEMPA